MIPISDNTAYRRTKPVVNVSLIVLNALVFLYALGVGGLGYLFGHGSGGIDNFFFTWGFIPRTLSREFVSAAPWITIFTAMFMHGGFLHFAGNMVYLWVFGDNVEDRMGHFKYLLFYLGTGVIATLAHWFFFQTSGTPLIGASGAISGVLGAYLLLFPYNRINVLVIFFIITAVRLPAMYVLGFYLGLQIFNLLTSWGVSEQVSVALWAHIGGFAAGAGIVAAYRLLTGQPVWPHRGNYPSSGRGPTQYWRGRPLD